jgi:serine/threonine-protein kinase HipA
LALDPEPSLDEDPFFPKPEQGNSGVFLDSTPARRGQTLMTRHKALQAKDEKRTPAHSMPGAFSSAFQT